MYLRKQGVVIECGDRVFVMIEGVIHSRMWRVLYIGCDDR